VPNFKPLKETLLTEIERHDSIRNPREHVKTAASPALCLAVFSIV